VTTQLHRFSFESHWQIAGVAGLDPDLTPDTPSGPVMRPVPRLLGRRRGRS
jgi:hypothetical protein